MERLYLDNFAVYRCHCQTKARAVLFFAHASGISSKTYESFLTRLSKELSLIVYAYDMRGFGFSKSEDCLNISKNKWLWDSLSKDHARLLETLKTKFPHDFKDTPLILMGHSLGAWITLLSSKHREDKATLIALDPPLYGFFKSLTWTFKVCLGLRRYHEIGYRVRKRRTTFPNKKIALRAFKRAKLMRNWPDKVIYDYIEGTFEERADESLEIRHNPNFEAMLFEAMPLSSYTGFSYIPKRLRQKMNVEFIVGEKSETCPKDIFPSIKRILKNSSMHILKKGEHMFPMENEIETISLIKNILKKRKLL